MHDELARLAVVEALEILDSGDDPEFDRLSALMHATFGVASALITIMDRERLWIKAGALDAQERSVPRGATACRDVVATSRSVVHNDLRDDPRLSGHAAVSREEEPRFYAGAPIVISGEVVGTVCLVDAQPRAFSDADRGRLEAFADVAADLMRARRIKIDFARKKRWLSSGPVVSVAWSTKPGWPILDVSENLAAHLGLAPGDVERLRHDPFSFNRLIHPEDKASLMHVLMSHLHAPQDREFELEYRLIDASGRAVWFRQFSSGEYDALGRIRSVQGILIEQTEQKQLESQVRSTLERMSLALDAAALGAWDCHVPTGELSRNGRWAALLGQSTDDLEPSLLGWRSAIHPLDRPDFDNVWRDHVAGTTHDFEVVCRTRRSDGSWAWLQTSGRAIERDEKGRAVRVVGTSRDITEKREAQTRQARQKKLLDILNQAQHVFFVEQDVRAACDLLLGPIIELSESQFAFIGEMVEDEQGPNLLVRAISDISWDRDSSALYALHARGELRFRKLDNLFGLAITSGETVVANDVKSHAGSKGAPKGHPELESFLGLPIRFGDQTLGMIGLSNRIGGYDQDLLELLEPLPTALGVLMRARRLDEERRAAEAELTRLARHDSLTGLVNLRVFHEEAGRALRETRRSKRPAQIALLDLDYFKRVNDTYGHPGGDAVLRTVADLLRQELRDVDVIGRLGGEEFAVLMRDTDQGQGEIALERVRRRIEATPVLHEDRAIRVTTSIGFTTLGMHASIEAAIARADGALYGAKGAGRNRVNFAGRAAPDDAGARGDVVPEERPRDDTGTVVRELRRDPGRGPGPDEAKVA